MRRRLPSTAALLAFEAAARRLSFTQAGQDLHLTQSAISHQVQVLEDSLGNRLFERSRQGIKLTRAGQRLLDQLGPALDALEGALGAARTGARSAALPTLQVAVAPTFASRWLIPRLPQFSAAHPDVQVQLAVRLAAPFDFADAGVDAAIYFGTPHWPQARCDWLMEEESVVVCSAEMARHQLFEPQQLRQVGLLHLASRPDAWRDWAQAAGMPDLDIGRGTTFELFSMVAEAAAHGLGAAVLPRFLILPELRDGKLVMPFGPALRSEQGYFLAYPEGRADLPAVRTWRQWLLDQVAQEALDPAQRGAATEG